MAGPFLALQLLNLSSGKNNTSLNSTDQNLITSEEPEFEHLLIQADPGQSPVRLDQFVFDRLSQVSRNKIQNAIEAGLIKVNNKITRSSYKIRPADEIQIVFPKSRHSEEVVPQNIPLNIIYEDEQILIIYKPAGMVVHPAVGNYEGTLVNALAWYLRNTPVPATSDRYGLVHRIDKETSGLLVVGKTDEAIAHLARQFFDHSIQREYYALVWGEPQPAKGTITGNIGRDPRNRQRMFVHEDELQGKHAVTHYEVLESFYYTSLIRCHLETGRTHQIRVHLKSIGHPLFNDERYDGDRIVKGTVFTKYKQFVQNCFKMVPRFPLHARSLGFIHPSTKKQMYFEVEPPEDFMELINKWRNYAFHRRDQIEKAIEDEEQQSEPDTLE